MGRVVAVLNQKGGVGKTTVTLGLASAAAHAGHRVLVVDMDPQGNLTMSQGIDPDTLDKSMYDVLVHKVSIREVVRKRLGQSRESRLRRDDVRAMRGAAVSGLAADVHDRAAATFLQVRQARLRAQERARQVRIHHQTPILRREVLRLLTHRRPGVVDKYIEPAQFLRALLDHRAHGRRGRVGAQAAIARRESD